MIAVAFVECVVFLVSTVGLLAILVLNKIVHGLNGVFAFSRSDPLAGFFYKRSVIIIYSVVMRHRL